MTDGHAEPQQEPTTLTPERYRRLLDIVDRAADERGTAREVALRRLCGADDSLLEEARALLRAREDLAPPDRLLPGSRIGAYSVERELGRGGMGAVYFASRADAVFEKQVAIKVMRPEACDEDGIARFRLEVQILAKLEHPNIARLLDAGRTDDGRPFIIIEYVDGLPLIDYADRRQLSVRERLRLFAVVCDAVAHAHRHRTIHRDLKPSNILVTADGAPKLLDFGIAKLLTSGGQEALRLTATDLTPGTPIYASPEQLRGAQVDERSDIYQLGVVLAELLTGLRPFVGGSGGEVRAIARPSDVTTWHWQGRLTGAGPASVRSAAALAADRRTTPRQLVRQMRGDLDAIVLMALHSDPGERYQSVAALRADLLRCFSGEPVQAAAGTVGSAVARLLRRRWAAGTAVGVLTLASFLWAFGQARNERASEATAADASGAIQAPAPQITPPGADGGVPRVPEHVQQDISTGSTPVTGSAAHAAARVAEERGRADGALDPARRGSQAHAVRPQTEQATSKPPMVPQTEEPAQPSESLTSMRLSVPSPQTIDAVATVPAGLTRGASVVLMPPERPPSREAESEPKRTAAMPPPPTAAPDRPVSPPVVEPAAAPAQPPADPREAIIQRLRAIREAYEGRNIEAPELARHPNRSALGRYFKAASRVQVGFNPQPTDIHFQSDGTAIVVSPWFVEFFGFTSAHNDERSLGRDGERSVRFTLRRTREANWEVVGWRWAN